MGRKGVSKRKTRQTNSKTSSSDSGSGSVSSIMQATESPRETGKTAPSTKDGGKSSSDGKKKNRKG